VSPMAQGGEKGFAKVSGGGFLIRVISLLIIDNKNKKCHPTFLSTAYITFELKKYSLYCFCLF
jgi:hypothetical protein